MTIPEYEQQLRERRKTIETAQQEAEAFKVRPQVTQAQLRGTKSPLMQQVQIKEVERKQKIAKAEALTQIQSEIEQQKQLEAEFVPVKQQYEEYQAALAEQAAYERVKKAADKGMVWALAIYGEGREKKIAQEWVKQERLAKQSYNKQVEKFTEFVKDFQAKNPQEKLNIDWKNYQIKGVDSALLGKSFTDIEAYSKAIEKYVPPTVEAPRTLGEKIIGKVGIQPQTQFELAKTALKILPLSAFGYKGPYTKEQVLSGYEQKIQAGTAKPFTAFDVPAVKPTMRGFELTTVGALAAHPLKTLGEVPIFDPFTLKVKTTKRLATEFGVGLGEQKVPFTETKIKEIPAVVPTKEAIARAGAVLTLLPDITIKGKTYQLAPATKEQLVRAVEGKPSFEKTTVTGALKRGEEALSFVGATAAEGISYAPVVGKYLAPVARAAPELSLWLASPMTGAAVLWGAGVEELKPEYATKQIQAQKIKAYEEYKKGIKTGEIKLLPLQRELTREEYLASPEVTRQISTGITEQAQTKAAIGGTVFVGLGAAKAYAFATKPITVGGRVKVFDVAEKTKAGKVYFEKVTQVEPTYQTTKLRRVFGLEPTKQLTRGKLFLERPVGVVKAGKPIPGYTARGKPYILLQQQVTRAPSQLLSEQQLQSYLKTAKFTRTAKGYLAIPVKAKGIVTPRVQAELFGKISKSRISEIRAYEYPKQPTPYGGITLQRPGRYVLGPGKAEQYVLVKQEAFRYYGGAKPGAKFETLFKFKATPEGVQFAAKPTAEYGGTIARKFPKVVPEVQVQRYETFARRFDLATGKTITGAKYRTLKGTLQEFLTPTKKNIFAIGKRGAISPGQILTSPETTRQVLKTAGAEKALVGVSTRVTPKPLFIEGLGITTTRTTEALLPKKALLAVSPLLIGQFEIIQPKAAQVVVPKVTLEPIVTTKPVEKVVEVPAVVQRVAPKEVVIPKLAPVVVPKIETVTLQKPVEVAIPREPTVPKQPKTPKPRVVLPTAFKIKAIRAARPTPERVVPFVRRRGTFIKIGPPTTKERALERGKGILRTTLAASLQVRGAKTGKLFPIAEVSPEFRPGKAGRDIFTLVQRKRRRLGTRAERAAIVRARRGGIKWY